MKNSDSFSVWPHYDADEIEQVVKVLESGKVNYWTGSQVSEFEKEFADYCHCKHAIALANGTVSLELALHCLGVGEGQDVIVPSRTYIATASAVIQAGARPVFADVDRISQNITVDTIEEVITEKTTAIIVVHLAGYPCDMDSIMRLAEKHELKVIEDCAQAHGARYKDKPVGGFGLFGSFSFCQDKIMSTGGEGGMLVTNDSLLWEKAWSYKDHGKDYQLTHQPSNKPGFKWLHSSVGTNLRMTEMQGAIGRLQLKKLDKWVEQRANNARFLNHELSQIPCIQIEEVPDSLQHAYYKYYCFIKQDKLASDWDRDKVLVELKNRGIPAFSGSCSEVYLEEAFATLNCRPPERFENARYLGDNSLMFEVHPTLKQQELERVVNNVKEVAQLAMFSY